MTDAPATATSSSASWRAVEAAIVVQARAMGTGRGRVVVVASVGRVRHHRAPEVFVGLGEGRIKLGRRGTDARARRAGAPAGEATPA